MKTQKNKKTIRVLILVAAVFLLGFLPSNWYSSNAARVHDYPSCDGIYVWDSEAEKGVFYLYYPYRNTTVMPTYTGTGLFVFMKQGDLYLPGNTGKHEVQITEKPLTRQDLMEYYHDPELVSTLMTHDYMTEFIISPSEFFMFGAEKPFLEIAKGPDFDLIPIQGEENLSYAFCKISGHINGNPINKQQENDFHF